MYLYIYILNAYGHRSDQNKVKDAFMDDISIDMRYEQ